MSLQPFSAENLGASVTGVALQQEIEQFYYREAWLLDHIEYERWLALLDDEIHYFMPLRRNRLKRDRKKGDESTEYSGEKDFAHFDDDIVALRGRVRKVLSEFGWSENPASRTRHLISNVMVNETDQSDTYEVSAAFLVYRNRLERQVDIFSGERCDVLKRADNELGFKISKRTILIDQSTIISNNLSIFF